MNPLVSVVIPAYNSAKCLPDAIQSVRAQNWPELEIIIVDDGSTDNTLLLLDELAGDDLHVLHQTNAGPATARNTGIEAARGDWIAFLDADDLWLPGKLAAQFEQIQRNPEVGFAFTDVRFQYESGEKRDVRYELQKRPLLAELVLGNALTTPTLVVRRDCLREVGSFDATMRTGEDWDLWLRLAARYKSVFVPQLLVTVNYPTVEPDLTKYPLEMLEHCTLRVMQHLFSCPVTMQKWPEVAQRRREIYAWQYTVLAKSYLYRHQVGHFLRLAVRALLFHPIAFAYLSRRGPTATNLARRRISHKIGQNPELSMSIS